MTEIPLRTGTSGRQAPSNEHGHVPEKRVTREKGHTRCGACWFAARGQQAEVRIPFWPPYSQCEGSEEASILD